MFFYICAGNSSNITIKHFIFMYHLMISSTSDSYSKKTVDFGLSCKPKHYYLSNADDVCEVLCSLNHLSDLLYTIEKIDIFSASDVLKDFELKEI